MHTLIFDGPHEAVLNGKLVDWVALQPVQPRCTQLHRMLSIQLREPPNPDTLKPMLLCNHSNCC